MKEDKSLNQLHIKMWLCNTKLRKAFIKAYNIVAVYLKINVKNYFSDNGQIWS